MKIPSFNSDFRYLLLILLSLVSTLANGASSFSSNMFFRRDGAPSNDSPTPEYSKGTKYSNARIYSEDDKVFHFRAFGCEFAIDSKIAGRDDWSRTVRNLRKATEGQTWVDKKGVKHKTEMLAMLTDARRTDLSEKLPLDFSCNSLATASTISITRRVDSDGSTFQLFVTQYSITQTDKPYKFNNSTWNNSYREVSEYAFKMEKDFFSPQQSETAIRAAGGVGKALLDAAPYLLRFFAR